MNYWKCFFWFEMPQFENKSDQIVNQIENLRCKYIYSVCNKFKWTLETKPLQNIVILIKFVTFSRWWKLISHFHMLTAPSHSFSHFQHSKQFGRLFRTMNHRELHYLVVIFKTSIFNFAWISGINHALIKYMKTVLLDPLNMANAKTYDTKTAKLWSKGTKKEQWKTRYCFDSITYMLLQHFFSQVFFSEFQSSVKRNEFFVKTNNWIWTIFFFIHTVMLIKTE